MENIVELLSWEFMDKLSHWRMKNEFDWATSPTNVNAFHTFQANAISELKDMRNLCELSEEVVCKKVSKNTKTYKFSLQVGLEVFHLALSHLPTFKRFISSEISSTF